MIYLDHAATTPVLHTAFEKMKPWLDGSRIGNPSSIHSAGKQARMTVEDARTRIAMLIGAKPEEIIFTSGGTESDNLALQGIAGGTRNGMIVSSSIEHHAIINQEVLLRGKYGVELAFIKTLADGTVDLDDLMFYLKNYHPHLVSVMLANNETGVIQPIQKIARLCERYGAALHTDAVQAVGHMKVNVNDLRVDLLSLSGHKFGAPDGIGVLYIRQGIQFGFEPIICGGEHERGIRAGTENVAAIVGLGAAAEWEIEHLDAEIMRYQQLKDSFMAVLNTELSNGDVRVNGGKHVLPNILNITIPGIQSEALLLMMDVDDVCISAASACSAGSPKPSHVLMAMGMNKDDAACTVRISFGRTNTLEEVVAAANLLVKNVNKIRRMYC